MEALLVITELEFVDRLFPKALAERNVARLSFDDDPSPGTADRGGEDKNNKESYKRTKHRKEAGTRDSPGSPL